MAFSSDQPSLVNQLVTSVDLPTIDDKKLFENRLDDILRNISNVINTKEGALYSLAEFLCFKQIFTTNNPQTYRNTYRICYDMVNLNSGNIAGGATVAFAHNIANIQDSIMIYISCVSTDPEYFTAVYPDVFLDATNINFINPHASAVSSAIAICEFTKD